MNNNSIISPNNIRKCKSCENKFYVPSVQPFSYYLQVRCPFCNDISTINIRDIFKDIPDYDNFIKNNRLYYERYLQYYYYSYGISFTLPSDYWDRYIQFVDGLPPPPIYSWEVYPALYPQLKKVPKPEPEKLQVIGSVIMLFGTICFMVLTFYILTLGILTIGPRQSLIINTSSTAIEEVYGLYNAVILITLVTGLTLVSGGYYTQQRIHFPLTVMGCLLAMFLPFFGGLYFMLLEANIYFTFLLVISVIFGIIGFVFLLIIIVYRKEYKQLII